MDDIMGVIPPSAAVLYTVPRMSAEQLRRQAMLAFNVDKIWRQDFINLDPLKISRHSLVLDSGVANIQIGPGGEWVVMQLTNRRLQLYQLQAERALRTLPHAVFKPTDGGSRKELPEHMSLFLSFSDGNHFAMTCNYRRHTMADPTR